MSVRKRTWTTKRGVNKESWVVDYVDQEGKRHIRTFDKKRVADDFAATVKIEVRDGIHVPERATVTVKKAADLWIESGKANELEPTTIYTYEAQIRLHIVPFIGNQRLSRLGIPAVRTFQDKLRENGRSANMVKRLTVCLGGILADAQERGLSARNAVMEMKRQRRNKGKQQPGMRLKRKLEYGVDIPTRDEVRLIIEHVTGKWRPFVITLIFTGMRASEMRALRWTDVDLEKSRIHVRQRADRRNEIGMPKSVSGQRTIPVPPLVLNTLREWKKECPESEGNLVFPSVSGKPHWYSDIVAQGIWPPQLAAGVIGPVPKPKVDKKGNPVLDRDGQPIMEPVAKYFGLHPFRHFFASWCINRRADGGLELPGKMVQQRLGHSTIAMTMDTYGHLFPSNDDDESLARAEQELLKPVKATQTRHGSDIVDLASASKPRK